MNRQIIAALQAGRTVFVTGRSTPEQEGTLAALYARGLLEIEQVSVYGQPALAVRLRRPRYVRVRVVEPTWYGWRVCEALVEVE